MVQLCSSIWLSQRTKSDLIDSMESSGCKVVYPTMDLRFLDKLIKDMEGYATDSTECVIFDPDAYLFSCLMLTNVCTTNAQFVRVYNHYIHVNGLSNKGLPSSSRARHRLIKFFRNAEIFYVQDDEAQTAELFKRLACCQGFDVDRFVERFKPHFLAAQLTEGV